MPPALKWPQRRATIGRAALCVRAALGVWLGGGRAAAPAASLGGLVRAFARPPACLALARCALCSLTVCAFAQGAPARRACVLPPVAAVVRGLRVGRARAVAFCSGVFLRWRLWGGGLALASCFRPACAVAVRLAAVSPSAGVVRAVLWRGAGWGGFRARWPSLRRRPGRLGRWPRSVLRPLGGLSSGFPPCFAPAARLRALSLAAVPAFGWRWGGALRSVSRRVVPLPPPRPRGAPPFPSSCFPLRGAHPGGNFSGGRGTTSRVLWPLAKVGCARGARPAVAAVSAVCLPAFGRARSACRAVCSFRALRRASPPSSGWPGSAVRDVSSSSVSAWGTGTRRWRSDRRRWRRFSPNRAEKPRGGGFTRVCTQNFVYKKSPARKYWQGTAGNGSRTQNRGE